jgi:imidazoleglycerol-phosphate dehydratase
MSRRARVSRATKETQIVLELGLDGTGQSKIQTPLPFLNHMLDQIARHGSFDLEVLAKGDVEIDGHHTTEDIGLAFGQALSEALGDHAGIRRYGSATLPMDEALVSAAVDLSGRAFFVWNVKLPKAKVGDFDAELVEVFFEAVARSARINLHLNQHYGHNLHHIIEISFKAFARALRTATELDPRAPGVPSTKGTLT